MLQKTIEPPRLLQFGRPIVKGDRLARGLVPFEIGQPTILFLLFGGAKFDRLAREFQGGGQERPSGAFRRQEFQHRVGPLRRGRRQAKLAPKTGQIHRRVKAVVELLGGAVEHVGARKQHPPALSGGLHRRRIGRTQHKHVGFNVGFDDRAIQLNHCRRGVQPPIADQTAVEQRRVERGIFFVQIITGDLRLDAIGRNIVIGRLDDFVVRLPPPIIEDVTPAR